MARARGEGIGAETWIEAGRDAEVGVARAGELCKGPIELVARGVGIWSGVAAKEAREVADSGVSVQLPLRLARRAQPRMTRGPGCCRSPINFLRQGLPTGSSDGG